jgi:GNAT superfamily N-acetyltransferase
VLSTWLANKTPKNVREWITSPSRFSVVAVDGSTVCGFGMLQRDGEIQLCYLVPEVQYRGAGKLMLRALEEQAARWGLKGLFLTSTVTAKQFYERNGYVQTGEPKSVYGLERAYPMSKGIALTSR